MEDSIVLIVDSKLNNLEHITGGDEATQQRWEFMKDLVNSLNETDPTFARCLLFRNNEAIVNSFYQSRNIQGLEHKADEMYPEE